MPSLKHAPANPTDRILMWHLRDADGGIRYFGALEDGTIVQQVSGVWSTVLTGDGDTDASFQVVLGMTELAESQGAVLIGGVVEFGIDEKVCADIRAGRRWSGNGTILLIGFDMAEKSGKR